MRLLLPAILIVAAAPALACQPVGPATANWAQCATLQVDAAAIRGGMASPAARSAWLARWRPPLTRACGAFTAAMAADRAAGQAKVALADELALLGLVGV